MMVKNCFPYILALIWGGIWALFLQWSQLGQFLAQKRTWITVVVGVGVDLVLILFVIPLDLWLRVCMMIVLSSLCIIARSLINEWRELRELAEGLSGHQVGEQDDLGAGGCDRV